mgnify:CR=1 FL=1
MSVAQDAVCPQVLLGGCGWPQPGPEAHITGLSGLNAARVNLKRFLMDGNRSKTRGVIGGQPLPQGVPSNLIALGGGYAFPDMLPDVSLEAANAARDFDAAQALGDVPIGTDRPHGDLTDLVINRLVKAWTDDAFSHIYHARL